MELYIPLPIPSSSLRFLSALSQRFLCINCSHTGNLLRWSCLNSSRAASAWPYNPSSGTAKLSTCCSCRGTAATISSTGTGVLLLAPSSLALMSAPPNCRSPQLPHQQVAPCCGHPPHCSSEPPTAQSQSQTLTPVSPAGSNTTPGSPTPAWLSPHWHFHLP